MNAPSFNEVQTLLGQLDTLAEAAATQPSKVDTARQWQKLLNEALAFLQNDTHPIVFVGPVGVGKSSLIGVLANLLIGPPPADRTSLKDHSILAIGSGRTTVCEVRIRARQSDDGGPLGLMIDPYSEEDMAQEIRIYAEVEWRRHHPEAQKATDHDVDPAQEIYRVIRGMTDYVEYQETYSEGGLKRRKNVKPIEDAVSRFGSADEFADHLIERAQLSHRDRTAWWWSDDSEADRRRLKERFAAINQGREQQAMLPHRMTVVVSEVLPEGPAALNLTLIDSRGLDGKIELRRDVQELLRDERALTVLCAPFKDAPGDTVRRLLSTVANDAELESSLAHTLLVIVDQGDAEQVNNADGDREYGQTLKIDECHFALQSAGVAQKIDRAQMMAFDVLKDEAASLKAFLFHRLMHLRQAKQQELDQYIADAKQFLKTSEDEVQDALRERVDDAIRQVMVQNPLTDAPLRDPLQGLYLAIDDCRYASVVYATCRRRGSHAHLDLYAAIEAEAARQAALWLRTLIDPVRSRLEDLQTDQQFEGVREFIRLRERQLQQGQRKVIRRYAEAVREQVWGHLKGDTKVWDDCGHEWGRGSGFKRRVRGHLEAWSRGQLELTVHENADAATEIPLLKYAERPTEGPRFTTHAQNLRVLRRARWAPEPVSVLIGANGAGKTTLLETLRLFRLAYERGLPEAVRIVLGGSSNLKSWGAPEEAAVQIGLDLDEVHWQVKLTPHEGTVDYRSEETLTEGERVVFRRDALGNLQYGETTIDADQQTGLRTLMDKGVNEPSIRRMAAFLRRIHVYRDPDIWTLRTQGSNTSEDRHLNVRGTNCLTLLRRWHQERAHRFRYDWVLNGLKASFPNAVTDLDFVEAGQTLVARIFRPGVEAPSPLANEANGVLQLLVLYCGIAAAEQKSVVTIDEPENSLHPYALRRFLKRTSRWARQHHLTVILATHSTVLLDELSPNPEQVYVMKTETSDASVPQPLDLLYDREWLEGFKLGDLYEQGEIGSNGDDA